jgi:hypothetical protein
MAKRQGHGSGIKMADTLESDFHPFALCPSGDRFNNPADKPLKPTEKNEESVQMARGAVGGGMVSAEPAAVEKLIGGTLKSFEALEIAAPEILFWLKASLSQAAQGGSEDQLKKRLKQLLGTFFFTANLDSLHFWDNLQEHCRTTALDLGDHLKKYYEEQDLGTVIGSGLLVALQLKNSFGKLIQNDAKKIVEVQAVHSPLEVAIDPSIRQDKVVPVDFVFDRSLSQMQCEQVYIHVLRMIGMGINDRFQCAVKEVCNTHNGQFKSGGTKGYTRMKEKCLSKHSDDYFYEEWPRPSCTFDVIRNTSTFDDAKDLLEFVKTMMNQTKFGGHPLLIKNTFAADAAEATANFNYRKVVIHWVFTPGITYGELAQEQGTAKDGQKGLWERYLNFINVPEHGVKDIVESWTSWQEQIKEAQGLLAVPELQDRQVQFIVETVCLLRPYKEQLVKNHMLYKIASAPTPKGLCSIFNTYDEADVETSKSYDEEQKEALDSVDEVVRAKGNVCHLALFETHMTMLGRACANGHHDAVKALLDVPKIRVNQTSATGSTPLYLAARSGHVRCVALLLENPKLQVNGLLGQRSRTPLYIASSKGYTSVVKELLSHPDVNVNAKFWVDGTTSLYVASQQGHASVVELLLGHPDIEVNACREDDDTTPLYTATCYGHSEVVKLLCAHSKCNPTLESSNGTTPLGIGMFKAGTKSTPQNPSPHTSRQNKTFQDEKANIVELLALEVEKKQKKIAADAELKPVAEEIPTKAETKDDTSVAPAGNSDAKPSAEKKESSSMCVVL